MPKPGSILHVGGVGWNSYLNSKLLNERGYTSHVAANDIYHCVCAPEWHEMPPGSIDRQVLGDEFFPNFFCLSGSRTARPRWFAQGPQLLVVPYLHATLHGHSEQADMLWNVLQFHRFKAVLHRTTVPEIVHLDEAALDDALRSLEVAHEYLDELRAGWKTNQPVVRFIRRAARICGVPAEHLVPPFLPGFVDGIVDQDTEIAADVKVLRARGLAVAAGLERYAVAAPREGAASSGALAQYVARLRGDPAALAAERVRCRHRAVKPEDAALYSSVMPDWNHLFSGYDRCLFYGGSAVLGLLSDLPKYMAYEHGTIRSIPFEPSPIGRLTRASYEEADAVFITNTDYIAAKPRLEFNPKKRVYLPHAFDERPLFAYAAEKRTGGRRPGPIRLFNPSRQDWVTNDPARSKGNHLIIDALAEVVGEGHDNFQLKFVAWGTDVDASRRRIADLGLDPYVTWIEPVTRSDLWQLYVDADAVLDQFVISGMSGVTFETLALGCRVITRDDGICNREFFGEGPPFMAASSTAEIAAHFRQLLADPEDWAGRGKAGQDWMRKFHSAIRFISLQEMQFARTYVPPASPILRDLPELAVAMQGLVDGSMTRRLLQSPTFDEANAQ